MEIPEGMFFLKDTHEYLRKADGVYYIGISEILADKLGYIVHAELPDDLAAHYIQKEVFAILESSNKAAEIHMPLSCVLLEVNPLLKENPEIINQEPYTKGWIVKVEATNYAEDSLAFVNYKEYTDTYK